MKQVGVVLALLGMFAFAQDEPVDLFQERPLRSRIRAFIVSTDARGEEKLTEATTAHVGQRVRYMMSFTNVTDDELPAGETTLSGPIPAGAAYIEDSATKDNFLVRLAGVGENRVRWTTNRDLPPRATVEVRYDVIVRRSAPSVSTQAESVRTGEGRVVVVYSADVFPLSCDFSVRLLNAYGHVREFARKSYGWRYSFVASPEDRLYLEVRSLCDSGSVTATIRVNDEVFRSVTSEAGATTAAVSGRYSEQ